MAFTGKEKTLVAVVGGALTSALTSGATFVAPDSTVAHLITAAIAVVGFVSTALGVYLVPNTKVGAAVSAVGDAVLDVQAELAPPPPLPADEVAAALGDDPVLSADLGAELGRHEAPDA